jgi:hypothetical protein
LLRHQSDPGGEIATRSKDLGIGNAGHQCRSQGRATVPPGWVIACERQLLVIARLLEGKLQVRLGRHRSGTQDGEEKSSTQPPWRGWAANKMCSKAALSRLSFWWQLTESRVFARGCDENGSEQRSKGVTRHFSAFMTRTLQV